MELGEGAEWEFELAVLDEAVRRALFFAGMMSATEAVADEGVVDADAGADAGADMYGEDEEVREDAYPPWALYEPAPGRTMRPGCTRPEPAP